LKKREGYISWDEYFMGVALLSAKIGVQIRKVNSSIEELVLSFKHDDV